MSIFDNLAVEQAQSAAKGAADNGGDFSHQYFWNPVLDSKGQPLELWKPKMGINKFDLLPWFSGNSAFTTDKSPLGSLKYEIQVDVNMKMGTGKTTEDLLARHKLGFAEDPIQAEQGRLFEKATALETSTGVDKKKTAEWKKALSLYPKKRTLYLIMVHETGADGKETKSVKLFSPAYSTFGKLLEKKGKFLEASGQVVRWADPMIGQTIYLDCTETSFTPPGGTPIKFPGYETVECIPRAKQFLPAEATEDQQRAFVDRFPKLDTFLRIPSVEDCEKALFGAATPPSSGPELVEPEEEVITASEVTSNAPNLNVPTTPVAEPNPTPSFEDDIPF